MKALPRVTKHAPKAAALVLTPRRNFTQQQLSRQLVDLNRDVSRLLRRSRKPKDTLMPENAHWCYPPEPTHIPTTASCASCLRLGPGAS